GGQVVADQLAVFLDGNEAEAVGENVNVVDWRNNERSLKLTRQIGFAVERVNEVLRAVIELERLAFDPDLVIGAGLGEQGIRHASGVGLYLVHERARRGRRRGHDVAVDIATGGEGGGHCLVDALHHRAEAGLDDAVKLKALTRGDTQRVIAKVRGEVV